jgi:DNA-binding Lrp family transcriptional regulator
LGNLQRGREPRRPVIGRPAQLDGVDHAILHALSEDAELTKKALARRLGLAESTCAYRLRSLQDRGVIRGTKIVIDPAALGFPLQAVIKVRLGSHTEQNVRALYKQLMQIPGVLQVFHVAGADDFLVHVAVADAESLRDLVLRHITNHRVVRGTETQLIFDHRDGVGVTTQPGPEPTFPLHRTRVPS